MNWANARMRGAWRSLHRVPNDDREPRRVHPLDTPSPCSQDCAIVLAAMELVPGATIEQFTLIECIGEGGTSAVWSARHTSLERTVAVKFLSREIADSDPTWHQRMSREASIGARIGSRNVVEIFGNGTTPDGTPYIAMELLEGIDVARAVIATGALTLHETVAIMDQVASVLERAHALGIVHRDIKPDNIFLIESREFLVKVLDFGIAKLTQVGSSRGRTSQRAVTMTKSGIVIGTPEFMSPEQSISSRDVDFRSDLFSLGMVAYFALTGDLPFPMGDSPTIWRRAEKGPTPVKRKRSDLPDVLDGWFRKALALHAADRFPSAKAMAESFSELVAPFVTEDERPTTRAVHPDLAKKAPLPAAGAPPEPPRKAAIATERASTAPPESREATRPSYLVSDFTAEPLELAGTPEEPIRVVRHETDTLPLAVTLSSLPTTSDPPAVAIVFDEPVPLALWLLLLLATFGAAAGLLL